MTAKIIPLFPSRFAAVAMTDERWEKELKRIKARMERIALAQIGSADVKKVTVDGGWVKRHYRKPHSRVVISLRTGKIETSKK